MRLWGVMAPCFGEGAGLPFTPHQAAWEAVRATLSRALARGHTSKPTVPPFPFCSPPSYPPSEPLLLQDSRKQSLSLTTICPMRQKTGLSTGRRAQETERNRNHKYSRPTGPRAPPRGTLASNRGGPQAPGGGGPLHGPGLRRKEAARAPRHRIVSFHPPSVSYREPAPRAFHVHLF